MKTTRQTGSSARSAGEAGLLSLAGVLFATGLAAAPLPPAYKYTEIHHQIIAELKGFPRPGPLVFQELPVRQWPEFRGEDLDGYNADYRSMENLRQVLDKAPTKQPLRAAVLHGLKLLEDSKFAGPDRFPLQPLTPKAKVALLKEQQALASMAFELEKGLERLSKAGAERAKEPSRRWQAHYDYLQALFLSRLVFCYEYNLMLAQVRTGRMPDLLPGCSGWRLGPRETPQIAEPKAKAALKRLRGLWKKIERDHPGTPWAALAAAERQCPRGLEWRPEAD
jgi:hypothetical protein